MLFPSRVRQPLVTHTKPRLDLPVGAVAKEVVPRPAIRVVQVESQPRPRDGKDLRDEPAPVAVVWPLFKSDPAVLAVQHQVAHPVSFGRCQGIGWSSESSAPSSGTISVRPSFSTIGSSSAARMNPTISC